MSAQMEITTVASRRLAVTHFYVDADDLDTVGPRLGAAFGAVIAHLTTVGSTAEGPAVAHYQRVRDGYDIAAGFPVAGAFAASEQVVELVLPSGDVAHVTHVGPYDRLGEAYDALRAGAAAAGRALDDETMWEEYWTGPDTPQEQARTEVYWPVGA